MAGLAIAFHPVVGMWSLIAAGCSAALLGWMQRGRQAQPTQIRRLFARAWLPLILLVVCALPGLVAALSVARGSSSEADVVQVFGRLRHHLDPREFSPASYCWYALLTVIWLAGRFWRAGSRDNAFDLFVLASLVIALVGIAIGFGPRPAEQMPFYELRAKLLKFYPFRLYDAVLPIAAAMTCVRAVGNWPSIASVRPRAASRTRLAIWAGTAVAFAISVLIPTIDDNPSRLPPGRLADWIDACGWIDEHAPRDALFLTPRGTWAFKWYAERPEFFAHKDCPQDAPAILEWQRRRIFLAGWRHAFAQGPYTLADLRTLQQETGVTHIIADRRDWFPLDEIYGNASYRVYQLQ
jgi:hypothetical protein